MGLREKVPWLFYRTKDKKAPHNAYASGERIQKAIEAMGYSQEYPESYTGHYRFSKKSIRSCWRMGFRRRLCARDTL